jgi:predicted aspartyl protease
MNPDVLLSVVLLTGWLVLVGSGIARRRQPIGKVALQGAVWIGIIAILWLVISIAMRFHR